MQTKILTKKDFPSWFDYRYKPAFFDKEPLKVFTVTNRLRKIEINEGDDLNSIGIDTNKSYIFDYDYDDFHDRRTCYLIESTSQEVVNMGYEKQLRAFNKRKATHENKLKEWEKWKKVWDANEKLKNEEKERNKYEELKKKYENG